MTTVIQALTQGDGLSICSAPEPWRCFYWGVKNAYDSHNSSPWETAKLQAEWFATYGEY